MTLVLTSVVGAGATVVHTAHTPSTLDRFGSRSDLDWGWRFTTDHAIQINAVGYYDFDANGLSGAHDVGIWRGIARFANPLASASVGPGFIGEYIDGFRYIDLDTPLRLEPGEYILSGSGGNDIDGIPADRADTILGEGIVRWNTVAVNRFFGPPYWTIVGGDPPAPLDGGNFRYSIIPEPSVPALFLVAMFSFGLRRHGQNPRRRNQAWLPTGYPPRVEGVLKRSITWVGFANSLQGKCSSISPTTWRLIGILRRVGRGSRRWSGSPP